MDACRALLSRKSITAKHCGPPRVGFGNLAPEPISSMIVFFEKHCIFIIRQRERDDRYGHGKAAHFSFYSGLHQIVAVRTLCPFFRLNQRSHGILGTPENSAGLGLRIEGTGLNGGSNRPLAGRSCRPSVGRLWLSPF